MNIRFFTAFVLSALAFLGGCTVAPMHPVYSGGVEVRTSGPYHYPTAPPYRYQGYAGSDPHIQIKKDQYGVVGVKVTQSGITKPEADWLIRKAEELKGQCPNGVTMKRYEIRSVERVNPYSGRSSQGDIGVHIEYECNRGSGNRPVPNSW